MLRSKLAFLIAMTAASTAVSEPLEDMDGTWRGSGWAKETPQSPQETVRCQITNSYETSTLTLTLAGQCVVPGRRLTIAGTLTGSETAEQITGRWSNPDGVGSTRVAGLQRDGIVAFTFSATDPATGRDLAQNVEWRILDDTLRLRSSDRNNPSIMMSDITFDR